MIINNLKIAIRSLKANLFYSIINVAGLAIGISASMMIALYVLDELSYDNFHKDVNRVYRVGLRAKISGQEVEAAATCTPMASVVRDEFPEVEDAIRLAQWQETPVKFENKAFTENSIILSDSNFFSFFSFNLIHGNPKSALSEPNQVILSESQVIKYFGDTEPAGVIGKIIEVGYSRFPCMITGIIEDAPENTHIPYNMILSMDTWEATRNMMWINNFVYNYIKLYPDANPDAVETKFADLVIKYVGPEAAQMLGMDVNNLGEDEFYYGYFLMPVKDIHLYSHLVGEISVNSDVKYVYIFSVIAVFILIIAIFNFVNLTTAKGGKRGKEVGIRKTAGALRGRLIVQFLMESTFQAFIAMVIAGAVIQMTMPFFNQIAQKNLTFNILKDPWLILAMLLLGLFVGLISGIYPALYLTSFKPAEILRGSWGGTGEGKIIRSALVILQFSISTFLIASTLLVYKQMKLLRTYDLGFNKDQVLVIKNGNSLGSNYKAFRENVLGIPGIEKVSKSTQLPPGVDNSSLFRPEGINDDQLMNYYWADFDHLETLGLKMESGRYYSRDSPSDSLAIVINQTAMERFGWDDYEGHRVLSFTFSNQGGVYVNVIGVLKDFNFTSLREDIQPMAIILGDFGNLISLKLTTDNYSNVIKSLEDKWKELSDGAPFDYYFLNEKFNKIYRSEEQMGNVFMLFTLLAIFIACLGLFGLATFTAEQKTREIGIRKALGASLGNIIVELSSSFMKLVAISIIISMPLAYIVMVGWLNGFAYKTRFGASIFIGTAILVLVVAFSTVSYQAITAGLSKPSDSLKVE